jgi:6-phospho-beta-glucosidase
VKYWLTFNEINGGLLVPMMSLGFGGNANDPKTKQRIYQGLHHQFLASAYATKLLHEIIPRAQMGCMIAYGAIYPFSCHPDDVFANLKADQFFNDYCLDVQVKGVYSPFAKTL